MTETNKENLLKDAVYETLSQKEIESKLKNNFKELLENPEQDIEIEVSEPLVNKLKNENIIILFLIVLIFILIGTMIYIW